MPRASDPPPPRLRWASHASPPRLRWASHASPPRLRWASHASHFWLLLTLFIVYGTVLPFHPMADRGAWQSGRYSIPDLLQNVLLFLPFGALGMLALRRPRDSRLRVAAVTGLAFAVSVTVEASQLFSTGRIASTADVVADSAGALIGALLAGPFAETIDRLAPRIQWPMVALALVSWFPYDVTLDVSTVAERLRPLRLDPWHVETRAWLLAQLLGFALFAYTIAASRPKRRIQHVLVAVMATLIVVDIGRPAMGAPVVGLAGVIAQMIGSMLGAGLGFVW